MTRVFCCAVALAVSCGPTVGDVLKTTGVKGGRPIWMVESTYTLWIR